jgi:hypothetical protein
MLDNIDYDCLPANRLLFELLKFIPLDSMSSAARAPARADRHRHPRRPQGPGDAAARVRRRAQALRARRARRRGPPPRRARGLLVTIRRSKGDQEQEGAEVAVPYAQEPDRCAVRALRRYLDAAGIHRGPVFRQLRRGDNLTDQSVALIIKRRATAAGVPPELLSGHSLRAEYATAFDDVGKVL